MKPFDTYCEDGVIIMCFYTEDEDKIWDYYDKGKWWLKYKNDLYFILIRSE